MKLTGKKITETQETIEVTPSEVLNVLQTHLWMVIGRPDGDCFIRDGVWQRWEEYYHGSPWTVPVGAATEEQIELYRALELIQSVLRRKTDGTI